MGRNTSAPVGQMKREHEALEAEDPRTPQGAARGSSNTVPVEAKIRSENLYDESSN